MPKSEGIPDERSLQSVEESGNLDSTDEVEDDPKRVLEVIKDPKVSEKIDQKLRRNKFIRKSS